jgi:hypothetical protein
MADGKTLRVTHPESLAYNPSGRTILYVAPDESARRIDLLLVVRIEIVGRRKPRGKARE